MNITQLLLTMSLADKIGQKIMLDFRYWSNVSDTTQNMIAPDETISGLIKENNIGGVILFSNNLVNKQQIADLTGWYHSINTLDNFKLFIGTDNEGGNVFRLPRGDYPSYPGNMALSAAVEGGADAELAYSQGRSMAQDMLSLQINTNFAPVVDVNTNPFNPVINVRSFGDDVDTVTNLGELMDAGMKDQGIVTTYKHFPGHGSTSTDSHTGLPRVDRTRQEAFAIDIAPYQRAIDAGEAPDMIMTAHIQYPSLDNTQVPSLNGGNITVPATMSYEIQTTILREQLGYNGVTISDALDMGAIADHFTQKDAAERVFTAGVDIALMPVSVTSPSQVNLLSDLIEYLVGKVEDGTISEAEVDASVERILTLKAQRNLLGNSTANNVSASTSGWDLQQEIADKSITVVVNNSTLPLKDKSLKYFIFTPWGEQGRAMEMTMTAEGYSNVTSAKQSTLSDSQVRQRIADCDVFMLGTLSTNFSPVENNGVVPSGGSTATSNDTYTNWLLFAASQNKTRIHLSLRAPYDIVNYASYVDASVASYSYYGYDYNTWRGPSMISLAKVITGEISPQGKLPVNVWKSYDTQSNNGTLAYPRGFGLTW